jgi:hypothetical protein
MLAAGARRLYGGETQTIYVGVKRLGKMTNLKYGQVLLTHSSLLWVSHCYNATRSRGKQCAETEEGISSLCECREDTRGHQVSSCSGDARGVQDIVAGVR